ncbi:MAG TPA: bifunctional adenosylcobinamide kinase/adenosylcobinamide-phosphate guanylyltransferase [Ilumatobacteraceae bacterium]|jgi:adenosyl cobinamide kinase/adenosyl cobinamide phosphate guanylyltransferase
MMAQGLTMLIGGARSGKSNLAVRLGEAHCSRRGEGMVTFVATAQAFDDDMEERIAHHRADRPNWPTIEAPLAIEDALEMAPRDHLVIIDCLTLWVSNAVLEGWSNDDVLLNAQTTAAAAARRPSPTVVVTNETGLGLHPDTELGRRYRDLLGRVNQLWAAVADRSLLLVAGRVLPLDDPEEYL